MLGGYFKIIFDEQVSSHFETVDRKYHSAILDEIEKQLAYEADVQTRNRKSMRIPNSLGATWELRCGRNNRYRVYYDVDIDQQTVVILAVGQKRGNRLFIGQEEFIL
jgi:mRNA-degrading endonuclease RelE of RelBE toxin-antitoxin system